MWGCCGWPISSVLENGPRGVSWIPPNPLIWVAPREDGCIFSFNIFVLFAGTFIVGGGGGRGGRAEIEVEVEVGEGAGRCVWVLLVLVVLFSRLCAVKCSLRLCVVKCSLEL